MKLPHRTLAAVLAVTVLCALAGGAAAEENAQEAESFYRSVLAARDSETLNAYLACFSREKQQELWAMLDDADRSRLTQTMTALGQTPPEFCQAEADNGWALTASAEWESELDCFTLRLEAWAVTEQPDAALIYRFDPAFDTSMASVRAWGADRTHGGWSQAKQELPEVQTDLTDGVLTVTGFDFDAARVDGAPRLDERGRTEYGRKLVVQVVGIRAAAGTFGGQSVPLGHGGAVYAQDENPAAYFADVPVDLLLRCRYAPVNQQLAPGEPVNFGYMIRPPHGDVGELPDGTNNAWCEVSYTIHDPAGQTMGVFTVPAGQSMGQGQWTVPLPDPLPVPAGTVPYSVTLELRAVRAASGIGPAGDGVLHSKSFAAVTLND